MKEFFYQTGLTGFHGFFFTASRRSWESTKSRLWRKSLGQAWCL